METRSAADVASVALVGSAEGAGSAALAGEVERHEREAWVTGVVSAAAVAGNPLGAEVGGAETIPLAVFSSLNLANLNSVLGLGIERPATARDIAAIIEFYAVRGQTGFTVELSPYSRPDDLAEQLQRHGLADTGVRRVKSWRELPETASNPALTGQSSARVERLSVDDLDSWSRVQLQAWGLPRVMRHWYGAALGREGFVHYGAVVDGEIVAGGAMYVSQGIAWFGFDATMPAHRGRGLQRLLIAHRIAAAGDAGCRYAHTETVSRGAGRHGSQRNYAAAGFTPLYEKQCWSPATSP